MTFTHCPHHGHLACQKKPSDVCWKPKTIAQAHTSIVSCVWFFGGFVVVLFYIISIGICWLYKNWLAESHLHHSIDLAVISIPSPPPPPPNLTHMSFHIGIIEKKFTYFSHHSGFDGMKALCRTTAPVKFSGRSHECGLKAQT